MNGVPAICRIHVTNHRVITGISTMLALLKPPIVVTALKVPIANKLHPMA
jgi:hypothetical protein